MAIYRKGEGQWTPEKQAGLLHNAKLEGEARHRSEGIRSSDKSPQQLHKELVHERGWAIGANPHIKASNVVGPVSGAGLAKGKATRANFSPAMIERQNENAKSSSEMKV